MSEHDDLLIEIGTEELPPKALPRLSAAFVEGIREALDQAGFAHESIKGYATPRRLALVVHELDGYQPDQEVERRGPAVKAAFDDEGNPTRALLGFCRSCGAQPSDLERLETSKGEWLVFRKSVLGKRISEVIGGMIEKALGQLPIHKRMRWGSGEESFVRPVHWVVVMHGEQIIPCTLLGQESDNLTHGHRFHYPQPIQLGRAGDYADVLLEPGKVIADFALRRAKIREVAEELADEINANVLIDEALLDEVTALNEWPVPIMGRFEERFLEVPHEVLIEAMQDHQKYFPVVDDNGKLLPRFITVANIESADPATVTGGNERVIRPRFSDAAFFWEQDLKRPLESRLERLKTVVFQAKLGSLYEKTLRVQKLAVQIGSRTGASIERLERAALLCKCDLMTDMVYEFTSLQGVMGRYYAERGGEDSEVAVALDEIYQPRFAGDSLPETPTGQILAIADRIDTLVGIFAVGSKPSGEKDPFGLRRAAIGVLRIAIETPLDIDLPELFQAALELLPEPLQRPDLVTEVHHYVLERLRVYYGERGFKPDVIESVMRCAPGRPLDFHRRMEGVSEFFDLREAATLSAANKRIANILRKAGTLEQHQVEETQLVEEEERALYQALKSCEAEVAPLIDTGEYTTALGLLAALGPPVDRFFEAVMVMAEEPQLRNNRLALLHAFHALFMRIADLSRLQH